MSPFVLPGFENSGFHKWWLKNRKEIEDRMDKDEYDRLTPEEFDEAARMIVPFRRKDDAGRACAERMEEEPVWDKGTLRWGDLEFVQGSTLDIPEDHALVVLGFRSEDDLIRFAEACARLRMDMLGKEDRMEG